MSLKDVIKSARENMTIDKTPSVTELAKRLDVSASYLYALEAGDHQSASVAFLKNYANETGIPVKTLIDAIEG